MARYINPQNESKEAFLARHGIELGGLPPSSLSEVPEGRVLVCLVNNGAFTAAAIAEDDADVRAFKESRGRPSRFFYVQSSVLGDEAPNDLGEVLRRLEKKGELRM